MGPQVLLCIHNSYFIQKAGGAHGVAPGYMPNMRWSSSLARGAARQATARCNGGAAHSSSGKGENGHAQSAGYPCELEECAINGWAEERFNVVGRGVGKVRGLFPFQTGESSRGTIGHWTQMIWSKATKVV